MDYFPSLFYSHFTFHNFLKLDSRVLFCVGPRLVDFPLELLAVELKDFLSTSIN